MEETIQTQIGQLMDEAFFHANVGATSEVLLKQMGQAQWQRLSGHGNAGEFPSTDFDYSIAIPHRISSARKRGSLSPVVLRASTKKGIILPETGHLTALVE